MTLNDKHQTLSALRHCYAPFDPSELYTRSCSACPYGGCSPDLVLADLRDLLQDIAPDDSRAAELVSCINYCLDNYFSSSGSPDDQDAVCSACPYCERCTKDDSVAIPKDVYAFLCDINAFEDL